MHTDVVIPISGVLRMLQAMQALRCLHNVQNIQVYLWPGALSCRRVYLHRVFERGGI